jgi:hypothetical protein
MCHSYYALYLKERLHRVSLDEKLYHDGAVECAPLSSRPATRPPKTRPWLATQTTILHAHSLTLQYYDVSALALRYIPVHLLRTLSRWPMSEFRARQVRQHLEIRVSRVQMENILRTVS